MPSTTPSKVAMNPNKKPQHAQALATNSTQAAEITQKKWNLKGHVITAQ